MKLSIQTMPFLPRRQAARALRAGAASLLALALSGCATSPESAPAVIDCPLRDQPYSVDTPLTDILLKPEVGPVVEAEAPGLMKRIPAAFGQVPSIGSTMSLRMMAGMTKLPPEVLARIDDGLKALPVTDDDRQNRCARYDVERPAITPPPGKPRLLVFEKINGFKDGPSVQAAGEALQRMAAAQGWSLVMTDKGGAITPSVLKQFDAVIWNNVSGDVLTLTQREAFRRYIENGGGFVGIHGSAGDRMALWDWYTDVLIGARFIGHPLKPQFQDARVVVDDPRSAIVRDLAPGWTMNDEWYSFERSPRADGAHVLATLDESSYSPVFAMPGLPEQNLRMGDHPIAWTRCVGQGRSFYSAIGHRPQTYSEPHHVKLLERGIAWAAGAGETACRAGREVPRL